MENLDLNWVTVFSDYGDIQVCESIIENTNFKNIGHTFFTLNLKILNLYYGTLIDN